MLGGIIFQMSKFHATCLEVLTLKHNDSHDHDLCCMRHRVLCSLLEESPYQAPPPDQY